MKRSPVKLVVLMQTNGLIALTNTIEPENGSPLTQRRRDAKKINALKSQCLSPVW
jgi:hypothetical protein